MIRELCPCRGLCQVRSRKIAADPDVYRTRTCLALRFLVGDGRCELNFAPANDALADLSHRAVQRTIRKPRVRRRLSGHH